VVEGEVKIIDIPLFVLLALALTDAVEEICPEALDKIKGWLLIGKLILEHMEKA
jgi:hypothetical protein